MYGLKPEWLEMQAKEERERREEQLRPQKDIAESLKQIAVEMKRANDINERKNHNEM